MSVGVRELKAHLSQYLARVRRGETVVVTDRGRPVARLTPAPPIELPTRLQALVESGRLVYKGPPTALLAPPRCALSPGEKSLSEYVREQRR